MYTQLHGGIKGRHPPTFTSIRVVLIIFI